MLNTFAEKITPSQAKSLQEVRLIYDTKDVDEVNIADDREYFYTSDNGAYSTLYIRPTDEEYQQLGDVNATEIEKLHKSDERKQELDDIARRAYQLRYDFIKGYTKTNARMQLAVIAEMMIWVLDVERDADRSVDFLLEMCDIDTDELNKDTLLRKTAPELLMLFIAYMELENSIDGKCHDNEGQFIENVELSSLYDFLERLGYEISDDEKAYMDGTHELFQLNQQGEGE